MCMCAVHKKFQVVPGLQSRRGWGGVLCVVWGDSDEYTVEGGEAALVVQCFEGAVCGLII